MATTRKYWVATLLFRSNHVHSPALAVWSSFWMIVHVTPSMLRCSDTGTAAADQRMPTVLTAVAEEALPKFTVRLVEVSVLVPVTSCSERRLVLSRSTVPV